MSLLRDKELNQYRDLVKPALSFEEGFGWKAVLGAIFVGVIMLPAAMYMQLALGEGSISQAAKWVTVILFLEMAKRARTALKPAEIFILFAMSGALTSSGTQDFFFRQYIVQSEAARSFGLGESFPTWWAPSDTAVLDQRSFFMKEWMAPLFLMLIGSVMWRIDSLILGYGLFRLTSDIEKLPFPMAPLGAAGVTALAENQDQKEGWRWRTFCIGTALGLVFGFLYGGIPVLTSTFLREPFELFPIPWLETSTKTQAWLPAVATGISFDFANFFIGMALPFFGVIGAFIAVIITMIANPLLWHFGLLPSWKQGMVSQQIMFSNNIDFYMSFGIGMGVAVAAIGIWQCVASLRQRTPQSLDGAAAAAKAVTVKAGRGDIRTVVVVITYVGSSLFYIGLCGYLLDWNFRGSALLWVLLFFAFIYTPFISYVTARLEGLAGQALDIPYIREAALILSGFKGVEVWMLPIPMHNYGAGDVVQYRTAELIGCSFRSLWKLAIFVTPLIFILSVVYGQFIWSLNPIPSAAYPYAMKMWDLNARNQCLIWSSTLSGFSPFIAALNPTFMIAGGVVGIATYAGLASFGLPVLLVYGVVKGLGQGPHGLITQLFGALFGRYVMAKRFGEDRWRQYAPVVLAGYLCGAGLVMMFVVGIKFLSAAIFQLPY